MSESMPRLLKNSFCFSEDALFAMTMLFSFLEIKKKLKQAGNNWWLLKYKNGADKNIGVKEIGYVEEN